MTDLELPITHRSASYRFFEILPGALSYGMILLLVILSFVNPFIASGYLLICILTLLMKAIFIARDIIRGHSVMVRAEQIDWKKRLAQLENPVKSLIDVKAKRSKEYAYHVHQTNLQRIVDNPHNYPLPSQIMNVVIIAAYNESIDVIEPTIQSLLDTSYNNDHLVVVLAYEARGGKEIQQTASLLQKRYADKFRAFEIVEHPDGLPDEVRGKGANITYAARYIEKWLKQQKIDNDNVIVTTLDSDNRPYPSYFDYVTYEYIVHTNRQNLSYQPIALYLGNIWDAPAPMRVIATGNSFWTIISSMRPHILRNFASHSQPMSPLVGMDYWSRRTIVEDGHQYWRSYFYFNGNYDVIPIHVPIYQDAVMANTYKETLVTQFKQLRRWAYGASDVPYVASRIFTRDRQVPFWGGFARFARLIDNHITLASMSLLVAFGGWIPLLINGQATRDIAVHRLPEIISYIQFVAMIGIVVTIFLSMKMLPPRPARYRRTRTLSMVLQWVLMPITAIVYNSFASFNAQTHLMMGKYLDNFDVTDKATLNSVAQEKDRNKKRTKKQK